MDPNSINRDLRLFKPAGNLGDDLTFAKLRFHVGQVIEARVISKEGNHYLLSFGEKQFWAEAENNLQTGQNVLLEVLGSKNGMVYLKRTNDLSTGNWDKKEDGPLRQLIAKYGFIAEKDIIQIESMVKNIPCDQALAVRFLLDPHVVAAILFPFANQEATMQKIEVDCYKSPAGGQDVFEVFLELELEQLGHIEIAVKSQGGTIFTRIWSQSEDTWRLLDNSLDNLRQICKNVELLSIDHGSLLRRGMPKKVDIFV